MLLGLPAQFPRQGQHRQLEGVEFRDWGRFTVADGDDGG